MVQNQTKEEEEIILQHIVDHAVLVIMILMSVQRKSQDTRTMHLSSIWWEVAQKIVKLLSNDLIQQRLTK